MNSADEIKLYILDGKIAFEALDSEQKKQIKWPDLYAQTMCANGLNIDQSELAALLREAQVSYDNELEQLPWINYLGEYIFAKVKNSL